jgi:uncharacterized protein YwqG
MLDEARARLAAAGLAHAADRILALARPAIRLTTRAAREGWPVGASRIGGHPDLPAGAEWPSWNGRRLSFLAQVNLEELRPYACGRSLPTEGLLQFFYDPEQETWGFDPKDRGSWAVLFQASLQGLQPTLGGRRFPGCRVTMTEVTTLPPWESHDFEQLGLTKKERDAYLGVTDALEDAHPEPALQHQLLGNPAAIQGDMQLECQLVSHGLYCGDLSGYNDPRSRQLEPGASDWRLLFQLDSDDAADMMWGDCGRLYFWMTEAALADRRFDTAWMILQCS